MTWKDVEESGLSLSECIFIIISLEGLRKITKSPSHENWSMGQDLNPGPFEYEVRSANNSAMTFTPSEVAYCICVH
jgi:hypothetical protein